MANCSIKPKSKRAVPLEDGPDNQVQDDRHRRTHARRAIAGSGGIDIDRASGGDFEGEVAGSGDLAIGAVEAGEGRIKDRRIGRNARREQGRKASTSVSPDRAISTCPR